MPTINQLVRKGRRMKKGKDKSPALRFLLSVHIEPKGVFKLSELIQVGSPHISFRCSSVNTTKLDLIKYNHFFC